jgi:adenosylmethionine-8-amino-7-oxononanoate aminotransferase
MALTKSRSEKKHAKDTKVARKVANKNAKKNAKKAVGLQAEVVAPVAAATQVAAPEQMAAPAPEYVAALSDVHTDSATIGESIHDHDDLQKKAKDHLWMHFTRQSVMEEHGVPIMVRGEGHHIFDIHGKKYLDGISSLFTVQVGHGRERLARAAAKQAQELAYFPIWSYAHPNAIELADKLADLAPGDLNRVFFTTGGGEAVETAFKLAKQYWKIQGRPLKTKVISRSLAYHGTAQGALSITGLPGMKEMFEPLVPGTFRVPNTNFYRAEAHADDYYAFGQWAANRIEEMIQFEGPETIAAVFLEPVQNSGGSFVPPPGYFQRVREICDQYDVLLVSDETICAFGRVGNFFASTTYDYVPDMLVCAKGMTSAYSPIGACIIREHLYEPFKHGTMTFPHGYTFAGHPVSAAVALENIAIFEEERLNERVRENSSLFRAELEKLSYLPIVGDIRGDGYFWGIELVRDKATKETFNDEESERLLRGFLSKALFDAGLYCRADDRGDPVVQLAPTLTMGPAEFTEMRLILDRVLGEAASLVV